MSFFASPHVRPSCVPPCVMVSSGLMLLFLRCFFWFFSSSCPHLFPLCSVTLVYLLQHHCLVHSWKKILCFPLFIYFHLVFLLPPFVMMFSWCFFFFSFSVLVLHLLFCCFFLKSVSCVWVFVLTIFNIYDLGQFLHGWSSQCCCHASVFYFKRVYKSKELLLHCSFFTCAHGIESPRITNILYFIAALLYLWLSWAEMGALL